MQNMCSLLGRAVLCSAYVAMQHGLLDMFTIDTVSSYRSIVTLLIEYNMVLCA